MPHQRRSRRGTPGAPFGPPVFGPAFGALILQGCSGDQSALNPKSPDAALIADLWWGMLIVGSAIMLAVVTVLLIGISRGRRDRPGPPLSRTGRWALVLAGGVVVPLVVTLALVISGVYVGRHVASYASDPAITVEVVGRRWWWEINYLDGDGRHVATTANEIHIPADRPVRFLLSSDNVIHSFWVPNLQGKTDLIPGQVNESRIRATETGVFRGQCAEYCGTQHALMGFLVVVEPYGDFQAWLERQGRPAVEATDPLLARGRAAFLAASCPACHTVRGTPASGTLGPDLTHVGSRRTLAAATIPNTRGHLGGWIMDPQRVKPGALMPPTPLEPADLQALLSYLESLE